MSLWTFWFNSSQPLQTMFVFSPGAFCCVMAREKFMPNPCRVGAESWNHRSIRVGLEAARVSAAPVELLSLSEGHKFCTAGLGIKAISTHSHSSIIKLCSGWNFHPGTITSENSVLPYEWKNLFFNIQTFLRQTAAHCRDNTATSLKTVSS